MDKNIEIKGNQAILKVNPKIYDLEVLYSTSYVFLDKAYIILDGDVEREILVKIKSKNSEDITKLSNDFFNELINYSDYKNRSESTKQIRELILQRALVTNDPSIVEDDEFDKLLAELEDDEDLDNEEISIPWKDDGD